MKKYFYHGKQFIRCWLMLFTAITGYGVYASAADTIQTNVPALKDVYKKDFYIGCLLSYRHVGSTWADSTISGTSSIVDTNGGRLVRYHMNSMSPGNNMKTAYTFDQTTSASAYTKATTQAAKDSINVNPVISFNADMRAQFCWAKKYGFTFRGHTLVWHSSAPTAFFYTGYSTSNTRVSKDTMTMRMENYIKEVIRLIHTSWPGLLSAIDVVNEAMNDDGTFRSSSNEWYTTFGDSTYVMKAFEFARKYTALYGETQIKLYYNDYNTHVATKASGIARLVSPIYRAGYLDGIGMQEHDAFTYSTADQWIASYTKFDTVCTEMAVTELDVTTGSGTNYPAASYLNSQANQYGQLFKCFVERSYKSGRGKIISVSKDGLNDSSTYVTNQSSSLWTSKDQCKPAFYAVVHVGQYYNTIDSLLNYVNTLQAGNYTTSSWTNLSSAVLYAQNIIADNYSVTVSADTALGTAKDSLTSAINHLDITSTGVDVQNTGVPRVFALHQNYPNPFNPSTAIIFTLAKDGMTTLKVYDVLGREVATLVHGELSSGVVHTVTFNATKLSSGIYFSRLESGGSMQIKKMVLMK